MSPQKIAWAGVRYTFLFRYDNHTNVYQVRSDTTFQFAVSMWVKHISLVLAKLETRIQTEDLIKNIEKDLVIELKTFPPQRINPPVKDVWYTYLDILGRRGELHVIGD
jgi:hypothetical protein